MRKSSLLLVTGFALGFGLGYVGWQTQIGRRLREQNARLIALVQEGEAARAENAKLRSERIAPEELKRLRDGQTELLRLRGQVSQLRREVDEARFRASRPATGPPTNALGETAQSAVETFTTQASATVGWQQAVIAGGWQLPSGKRGFVMLQPAAVAETPGAVQVSARILEVPSAAAAMLDFLTTSKAENAHGILEASEARKLMARLQAEGAEVLTSPTVVSISGRQAQISVGETTTLPNGQTVQLGPVIDLTPTIGANGNSVVLDFTAQLTVRKATP
jgi:hypothetical protein